MIIVLLMILVVMLYIKRIEISVYSIVFMLDFLLLVLFVNIITVISIDLLEDFIDFNIIDLVIIQVVYYFVIPERNFINYLYLQKKGVVYQIFIYIQRRYLVYFLQACKQNVIYMEVPNNLIMNKQNILVIVRIKVDLVVFKQIL